jgi:hypothetical protein
MVYALANTRIKPFPSLLIKQAITGEELQAIAVEANRRVHHGNADGLSVW